MKNGALPLSIESALNKVIQSKNGKLLDRTAGVIWLLLFVEWFAVVLSLAQHLFQSLSSYNAWTGR
jgi:hypothetical protein